MGSQYLGRKILQALITIVLIVIVNFLLFRALPGSPDRVARNPNLTQDQVAANRAALGIDKPLFPDQFVIFVSQTLQGDLGDSYKYRGQSVVEVIGAKIGPTVLLIGLGEIFAVILGIAIGALTGWRRNTAIDYGGTTLALVLYSMPYFWPGMIFLVLFGTTLHWFPSFGMETAGATYNGPFDQLIDIAAHLVLPVTTVALGLIGEYSLLMRSSLIEVLAEDYVQTARAKGLTDGRVLRRHALPNAMLPMVTIIAINAGYIIAGAITIEVVFSWPGLGTLTVEALTARDYPVLQGLFLLLSVSVVVANLISDLIYGFLDPRVKA